MSEQTPAPQVIYLGSLQFPDSRAMMRHATKLARELARRMEKQKLYSEVGGVEKKKFVKVDGWSILGAMIGVGPVEESCDPIVSTELIPIGYKARVQLLRLTDGLQIGGASAICYLVEKDWQEEAFATHSKTITRATSKAFRLSFAWIMVLAGFQSTPAEEMYVVEGTQGAADAVAKKKLEDAMGRTFDSLAEAEAAYMDFKEAEKVAKKEAKETVFITWPESHHGNRLLLTGKHLIWGNGLQGFVEMDCFGTWNDRDNAWYISAGYAPKLRARLADKGIRLIEKNPARYGNL